MPADPTEMSEQELLDTIVEHAHAAGWLVMHSRPVYSRGRWLTPLQGDVGFPDLVMAHPKRGRLIFAELKAAGGRMGPRQQEWLDALGLAAHYLSDPWLTAVVWRPTDLPTIISTLYGRAVVA